VVDGLGGLGLGRAASRCDVVTTEHASLALLRLAREGETSLCCLGPLTNVALALRLVSENDKSKALNKTLNRLVCMGGAVTAAGNTSATAEFNVCADAEAAHVVFSTHWHALQLVTWELTKRTGLRGDFLERWLSTKNPRSSFLQQISQHLVTASTNAASLEFTTLGFLVPDPLAAAVAVSSRQFVTASVKKGVLVELAGRWARGQTVVDWNGSHLDSAPSCVEIVESVDQAMFEALLLDSVENN
jgi:purine nucleosidase